MSCAHLVGHAADKVSNAVMKKYRIKKSYNKLITAIKDNFLTTANKNER